MIFYNFKWLLEYFIQIVLMIDTSFDRFISISLHMILENIYFFEVTIVIIFSEILLLQWCFFFENFVFNVTLLWFVLDFEIFLILEISVYFQGIKDKTLLMLIFCLKDFISHENHFLELCWMNQASYIFYCFYVSLKDITFCEVFSQNIFFKTLFILEV